MVVSSLETALRDRLRLRVKRYAAALMWVSVPPTLGGSNTNQPGDATSLRRTSPHLRVIKEPLSHAPILIGNIDAFGNKVYRLVMKVSLPTLIIGCSTTRNDSQDMRMVAAVAAGISTHQEGSPPNVTCTA